MEKTLDRIFLAENRPMPMATADPEQTSGFC